jgi:hypothetical protein
VKPSCNGFTDWNQLTVITVVRIIISVVRVIIPKEEMTLVPEMVSIPEMISVPEMISAPSKVRSFVFAVSECAGGHDR